MPPAREPSVAPVDPGDDPRARLAELYDDHADFVVRVARQLGAPASELEDIVHDVFLVVHRRHADYDPARGSQRAWLYGICRNVVHHSLRGRTRAELRLQRLPEPAPRPGPDEHVAQPQAQAVVQRFLDGLDEGRRLVFALIDIEGMPAPEVAAMLELNLNTVYSRLRLARRQFEAHLARLHREIGAPHG
ncbi:MAG: sigma-70 family RNA polymerase sigma factor [Myxococcales bacterium]|nr:sigma-70 family RNA polymerase sigma factor [Myxococcales bacterium]